VNIDMLGRLREGNVVVMGWRSAPGLRARLAAVNQGGDLNYSFTPKVIADSDHYPFYEAGIPSLHFDSGKHEDYHRPTDDADKLNYPGIRRLAEMVFRLAYAASEDVALPHFRHHALTEAPPRWLTPQPAIPVPHRLGIAFDPQEAQQNIAVVVQVVPGSPAARAGIRAGDRITKMAHWDAGRVDDLQTIIRVAKNPLAIRIQRRNTPDPIPLSIELLGDPVRLGISWQIDAAMPNSLAITHVVPDSPADRAGLKVGDIVMSLGGKAIVSDDDFRSRVLTEAGPLQLRTERCGRVTDLSIDLFEPELSSP
jgi:aminopeptidase YwaD